MYHKGLWLIVMASLMMWGVLYSDCCIAQSQADKEICCQQQKAILAAKKRIDGYLLTSRLISKAQLDTWGDDPKDLLGNPSRFLPMIDYYRALLPKALKMGLDFAVIAGLREIDQAYQRIAVTCETPVRCDGEDQGVDTLKARFDCQARCKKDTPRDSSGLMDMDWYYKCHDGCK